MGLIAALLAAFSLAAVAGTAEAATAAPQMPAADSAAGTLDLQFAVNKFVVRGKKLVAVGNVIGTFTSAEGTEAVAANYRVRRAGVGSWFIPSQLDIKARLVALDGVL